MFVVSLSFFSSFSFSFLFFIYIYIISPSKLENIKLILRRERKSYADYDSEGVSEVEILNGVCEGIKRNLEDYAHILAYLGRRPYSSIIYACITNAHCRFDRALLFLLLSSRLPSASN